MEQGTQAKPGAAAAIEPRAKVGVLLVHGIGDHREGETLLSFGEPMIDWLREWLRRSGGKDARGRLHVVDARLKATRTEADSPAYALAQLSLSDERDVAPERWLFTEAWWGETVQPPDSLRLLSWLLARGPLLLYAHFLAAPRHAAGSVRQTLRALAAFGLASALQALVLLALLLWLIPIGPWRRALGGAVRALTLTLGDSFVLLEQDVQRAAMVARVRRMLAWLDARVERIAVVAHSQGGAIAHEALRAGATGKVKLFASLGSGLEKLQFLCLVREHRNGIAASCAGVPCALAGVPMLFAGLSAGGNPTWPVGGFVLCVVALVAAAKLRNALEYYAGQMSAAMGAARLTTLAPDALWLDLYASDDPVPMGLRSFLRRRGFVRRERVVNRHSLLHDHTLYFSNRYAVLPRLWRRLATLSDTPLTVVLRKEALRLRALERVHRGQAAVLRSGWWLALGALGWALVAFHSSLADFGVSIAAGLTGAGLGKLLLPLGMLESLLALLWPGTTATPADVPVPGILGAAALALTVGLWWLLYGIVWRLADFARWRRACLSLRPLDVATARRVAWLWLLFTCLPLVVVVSISFTPEGLSALAFGRAVAEVGAVACAVAAWVCAGVAPWALERARRHGDDSIETRMSLPVGQLVLLGGLQALALWWWPDDVRRFGLEALLAAAWVAAGLLWLRFAVRAERPRLPRSLLALLTLVPLSLVALGAALGAGLDIAPTPLRLGMLYGSSSVLLMLALLARGRIEAALGWWREVLRP
jgi:hypothetical protein